jgi:hypothetical protein
LALDSAPFQPQFKIMKTINQRRIVLKFLPLLVLLLLVTMLMVVSALLSAGATHT